MSLLFVEGCGERGTKEEAKNRAVIQAKLEAIRQAGEPITLDEINTMYVEPPSGQNAAPIYAEAFEALTTTDPKSPSFVTGNSKAIDLLQKAATHTSCRYPTDLSKGFEALLPHLSKMKTCANLLAMDAVFKANKGHADLAAQSISAGLTLSRSLEDEPTLVSQAVRASTIDIAFTGIEVSLNLKPLAEAQLAELQGKLSEAASKNGPSFRRGLLCERVTGLALFHSSKQLSMMAGLMNKRPGAPQVEWSRVKKHTESPAFSEDEELFLDSVTSLIATCEDRFPARLDAAKAWEACLEDAKGRKLFVSAMILPDLAKITENSANTEGELHVAEAVMAVERFRIAHSGELPNSLRDMVPQYLKAVPDDPFDGLPLRFKKHAPRGYSIYSIGPDRHDDGGVPIPARASTTTKYDLAITISR